MGAGEWTGYSSPAVGSYTPFQHYDQAGAVPAILPTDGISYNHSDYHCGSAQNTSSYNGAQFAPLTPWSNEVDQYNYGYNSSYQYSYQPPTPAQYTPASAPPGQATMVLCPQVYSTVNQNQIHLHLHGTDKQLVEQYLGGSGAALQSDISPFSAVISNHRTPAIEMSDSAIISQEEESGIKQHQEQSAVDSEVGDQGVWRPY